MAALKHTLALNREETMAILRRVMPVHPQVLTHLVRSGQWDFAVVVPRDTAGRKRDWFLAFPKKLDSFLREGFGVSLEEVMAMPLPSDAAADDGEDT